MEITHEIIDFGTDLDIKCYLHKLGFSERHWHESWELLFVLSGTVSIILEDKAFTLQPEDLLMINSNEIHELSADECVLIGLQIKPSFFAPEFPDISTLYFNCNSRTGDNSEGFDSIRNIIARMVKANSNRQPNHHILNKSLAYQLLYLLAAQFLSTNSNLKNTHSKKNMERVTQIAEIIDKNYKSELTLAFLAKEVHLSVPYLSRFFDKQLGTTFLQYLNSIRLSHAVNELLSTDYSIEQIATDNGFRSAHSFVQIFKRNYNCLPSVYRRNHLLPTGSRSGLSNSQKFTSYIDMEQYDYMGSLGKYLNQGTQTDDSYQKLFDQKMIIENTKTTRRLTHKWKTLLTVASAKSILYQNVREEIAEIQQQIGYRYISFHGILSDEMQVYHRLRDGASYYSFTLIDEVIDFLLSVGLKPFIQLSFMPRLLARDPEKICCGYITSPPNDMEEWKKLVAAVTQHLLQRYGEQEVTGWPFCVWNEPDTNYHMFGFETYEEFYPFYQATYETVKACNSNIRFGSPSNYYLTEHDQHWIGEFLIWCKKNHCMPDFMNVHFYSTTFSKPLLDDFVAPEFNEKIFLSQDAGMFETFISQITSLRAQLLPQKPIYLTEWNASPSHSDLLNDTCFLSCYIVKNLLENYDVLDSYGFWTLSDFMEESPLLPQTFQGGLGMITSNGVKKPVYYALTLLNRLGDDLVERGDGWFLTSSGDTYQLLLYNYKHFSPLYAQGEVFDMTATNRYATFAPEEQAEVSLTIKNLKHRSYRITETAVNRHSGSSFDKWVEMGATEPCTPEDLSALKSLSVPMPIHYTAATQNHTLKLSLHLEMLEVKLLILRPEA